MVELMASYPFRLICISDENLEHVLFEFDGKILGVLAYSATEPDFSGVAFPCAWVEMTVLGKEVWYEVLVSSRVVTTVSNDRLNLSRDGEVLFGSLVITDGSEFKSIVFDAYSAIFEAIDAEGYSNLLRVWNYFPGINHDGQKLERYREFNIGRHDAFAVKGREIREGRNVPAACALGTHRGSLVICFLAAKKPGIGIENPRQTNAYRYPRDFGPNSPTFSRGVIAGASLLISGTASIIGSETVYPESLAGQLDETLENIRLVIERARKCGFEEKLTDRLFLNVYLRHAENYPYVSSRLEDKFCSAANIAYMQADVCRADLMLEIEAFVMADN